MFPLLLMYWPALWVLGTSITAGVLLFRQRRAIRGTTLVGPWLWMQASLLGLGITHLVVAWRHRQFFLEPTAWETAALFAAAASSCCPLMSLLGAKRPQDRGWHFVVISLWAILVLPVAESLVLRHGQMPDVRGARCWFMLVLIAFGVVNSLPTRFWFPALLFGSGQVLMLGSSLPLVRDWWDRSPTIAGFSCCAIAMMLASQLAGRRSTANHPLDTVWIDFRDAFGLLWGLRFAEQINTAARTSNWPLALRWQGFLNERGERLDAGSLSDATRSALEQVLKNLLRRFVSQEWIAARLHEAID